MLSSDRLKAFASLDNANESTDNWDNNFEGDLVTIKPSRRSIENDSQELETIRPYRVKPTIITQEVRPPTSKMQPRKISRTEPPKPKSPVKAQIQAQAEGKFLLPVRPAMLFREVSMEDYSDLQIDNDNVFDRRLNIIKVGLEILVLAFLTLHRMMPYHQSYSTLQISQVYLDLHRTMLMEA